MKQELIIKIAKDYKIPLGLFILTVLVFFVLHWRPHQASAQICYGKRKSGSAKGTAGNLPGRQAVGDLEGGTWMWVPNWTPVVLNKVSWSPNWVPRSPNWIPMVPNWVPGPQIGPHGPQIGPGDPEGLGTPRARAVTMEGFLW